MITIPARKTRTRQMALHAARILFALLTIQLAAAGQNQLSLAPIELLPNAPATYQMRDWNDVAENFDRLAFDTTATGQFLPIPRRKSMPQSAHLSVAYGLPSYVGDRHMSANGELVSEAIPTLGAVLGSTLIGIDKTAGPINWVSMTLEFMRPFETRTGGSAWYELFPMILFYSIADSYPNEAYLNSTLEESDAHYLTAVNVLTADGTAPEFNHSGYDFSKSAPRYNGHWREPDMGLGMAWLQHAAYRRNRESSPKQAALHLQAVDRALAYYEKRTSNPHYEILTSFGAYTAARMNAEHARNYNVHKYLDWVFSRSDARPDLIMISGEQWGGQDVGGLMGGMRANTSNVQGYAFSMNTYANAMPVVALARYEDRYGRAIGKWMLNAASAARLFYRNAHPRERQSSGFWLGDPQSCIAYEGLRHHWLPENLLKPSENEEIYAAGDPLTYGWGQLTDFGIYGSAFTGVLGSIIKTTNVDKILQLDLLATDFYHDAAYKTFLYYNPYSTDQSVSIDLGTGRQFDLYDAVSNRFLKRSVTGKASFNVPKNNAVMLVLVPSDGTQTQVGSHLLVDGVVIDYNATLLAGNLIRNPDVDSPLPGIAGAPTFWIGSSNSTWSNHTALSPTHSLELSDNSETRSEEWRSYATAIPNGTDRKLELRWFWKHNIASSGEFRARLRLSTNAVTGADLTNPSVVLDFVVSGTNADFEKFEKLLRIEDTFRSFDLTFITGGVNEAKGSINVDDISVVPRNSGSKKTRM